MEANENLYREKERRVYFKPLLILLGLLVGEVIIQAITQIAFINNPMYQTISWFSGKLVAAIAAIIFFIGYFKDVVNNYVDSVTLEELRQKELLKIGNDYSI